MLTPGTMLAVRTARNRTEGRAGGRRAVTHRAPAHFGMGEDMDDRGTREGHIPTGVPVLDTSLRDLAEHRALVESARRAQPDLAGAPVSAFQSMV
jgi:hypothetical protein